MAETLVQRLRDIEPTFAGYDVGETITEAATEIERLTAEVERYRAALERVIQSRDANCNEAEALRELDGRQFWSPVMSMVNSEAIAFARQALACKEGG